MCRSREGAWIEIHIQEWLKEYRNVAPARERELKCSLTGILSGIAKVAPARERELKYSLKERLYLLKVSLPRGSVN